MRPAIFALFVLSGFCGLCYEIVWLRLAMAAFGATTPVVSVVVSVFMGGLAVGAWAGGRWVTPVGRRAGLSPLVLYALTECLIAPGAVAVPYLFARGEDALLGLGEGGSVGYLASSAAVVAAVVLPWAVLMGATFPVMMAFLAGPAAGGDGRGFSYLYLANICGAATGSLATAFVLIEVFGFRGTLLVAGGTNLVAAAVALALAARVGVRWPAGAEAAGEAPPPAAETPLPAAGGGALFVLFATGFLSMGLEVAWARAFGGMLGQSVYGFSLILAVYLVATAVGAAVYREAAWRPAAAGLLFAAGGLSLLPLVTMDPTLASPVAGVVVGLAPLCVALGYLTPRLVDEYSGGDPRRAGRAYAANVVGCVLGPLVASYVLLAFLGERWTIVLLSLGFTGSAWVAGGARGAMRKTAANAALAGVVAVGVRVYNEGPPDDRKVIRTDYSATVVSIGRGMNRHLYVNGTSMTVLTRITKYMVHLPAAHHPGRPQSALIICFGMGTTYRSALSWGMRTTVVELTPSVFHAFEYYHADAGEVRRDPNGRMVVDDGRRFLKRTREGFDVIVIDPPPPISSPGSGMLHSTEFYREAARRLNPGGVLQQWYPHGEGFVYQPLLRSVRAVFPYTRVMSGCGGLGVHVLASMDPLPALTPAEFAARLPPAATADEREWPPPPAEHAAALRWMFDGAAPVERHLTDADTRELTDDRPLNEYYFLREGLRMTAPPERGDKAGVSRRVFASGTASARRSGTGCGGRTAGSSG